MPWGAWVGVSSVFMMGVEGLGGWGLVGVGLGGGGDALHVLAEEVVVEDEGDAEEELGVDGGALEEFVDVGTVAIEFAGEPTDGSLLAFEFFLDEFADVQGG